MPSSMYYSSSSSSDDHDDSSEEKTFSLQSLASSHAALFQELESSSSTSDHSGTSSTNALDGEEKDEDNQTSVLPTEATLSYPRIMPESEAEDDSETISTLKLEEKIVSLMNRVWILETENDILLSRWKKDGNDDTTIQTMYQDPYEAPSISAGVQKRNDNGMNEDAGGNDGYSAKEDSTSANAHGTAKSEDSSSLADQNQSLRTALSISHKIGERMRIEMMTLGHREKLWEKKMEKTTKEKETIAKQHQKAMESLRQELEAERFKNKQLKIEKQKVQIASAGKKRIHGSTATAETAQLISDLSSELNLTMERESKLKGALKEAKFMIAKQSKETLASLDKHQREKDALLKHNDELESLNIELVHKLDDLERQSNKLFTKLRKQEREKGTHSRTSDDMVKMEDYLYTLAMKYEESQKEIALLKSSLDSKETKILELTTNARAGAPLKTKRSLTAHDKEIIKVSSRIRKQNEHMVRMVYDKEVYSDEQREEEEFESNSIFPNRVAI